MHKNILGLFQLLCDNFRELIPICRYHHNFQQDKRMLRNMMDLTVLLLSMHLLHHQIFPDNVSKFRNPSNNHNYLEKVQLPV